MSESKRSIAEKLMPVWRAITPKPPQSHFYPTHVLKFVVLTLSTLTLYEFYWLYRNWTYLKSVRTQQRIIPLWRSIFSVVWLFSLADEVFGRRWRWLSAILFAAYLVCSLLSLRPAPGWLFAFGALLALLPIVMGVNRLNAGKQPKSYSRFNFFHKTVTAIGLPVMVFAVAQTLAVVPTQHVFRGDRLFSWHHDYLKQVAGLQDGERVIRFYSDGFFSIAEDGNYFTDQGVVSYWRERGANEVAVEAANYSDIETIKADYAHGGMKTSKIKITRKDGSFFFLVVTNRRSADNLFVAELNDAWESRIPE